MYKECFMEVCLFLFLFKHSMIAFTSYAPPPPAPSNSSEVEALHKLYMVNDLSYRTSVVTTCQYDFVCTCKLIDYILRFTIALYVRKTESHINDKVLVAFLLY